MENSPTLPPCRLTFAGSRSRLYENRVILMLYCVTFCQVFTKIYKFFTNISYFNVNSGGSFLLSSVGGLRFDLRYLSQNWLCTIFGLNTSLSSKILSFPFCWGSRSTQRSVGQCQCLGLLVKPHHRSM